MAKRVVWSLKDDNNYWYDGNWSFREWQYRAEYRDREAAVKIRKHVSTFRTNITLVRIGSKQKKDNKYAFQAGDIWEWADPSLAASFDQRVGWQLKVDKVIFKRDQNYACVSFVGGTDEWFCSATEGLKLVERNGKSV